MNYLLYRKDVNKIPHYCVCIRTKLSEGTVKKEYYGVRFKKENDDYVDIANGTRINFLDWFIQYKYVGDKKYPYFVVMKYELVKELIK